MALPTPEQLYPIVKITPDTSEAFLAKLSAAMSDAEQVKNGYRAGGLFSFYIPGFMYTTPKIEVNKALQEAGWQVHALESIQGYMPKNDIIDFRNVGPGDPDVTGPSTFVWYHVQISKKFEGT